MKYAPYSFSKLSTYKSCSRKFKYVYIDKVPVEKTDITALLKGGAIHSIIEHYPEPSNHKLADKYKDIVDKFISSRLGQKYLSINSTREYDFGLTKSLQPCLYNDKDALFRGSIDYIAIIDNDLFLCDWKSGKQKDEKYQDYNQLMFYAIYFFQKYPSINKINISYVYVEHDEIENSLTLDRQYLNNYISDLINLIKSAEHEVEFKKNVTRLCDWCEYKSHCDVDE